MANVRKGGWGGPRENSGGARPGSGRKRGGSNVVSSHKLGGPITVKTLDELGEEFRQLVVDSMFDAWRRTSAISTDDDNPPSLQLQASAVLINATQALQALLLADRTGTDGTGHQGRDATATVMARLAALRPPPPPEPPPPTPPPAYPYPDRVPLALPGRVIDAELVLDDDSYWEPDPEPLPEDSTTAVPARTASARVPWITQMEPETSPAVRHPNTYGLPGKRTHHDRARNRAGS